MRLGLFFLFTAFFLECGPVVCGDIAAPNPFGKDTEEPGEAALVGIFYDLKQTQDRQPVAMDHPTYFKIMEDFVKGGWDEQVLNKFYRASKPLYTTQFFLPLMGSNLAPAAFGVEKYCQGGFWLAHYKGQVIPPKDGTYRFVGWADCQIFIAVNGKLAMVSDYWVDKPALGLPCTRMSGPYDGGGGMMAGPWIDFKKSEPVDLDIMWGDNGGDCGCFLQIEKKGTVYTMDNGYPILPIFQVAPFETKVPPGRDQPKYAPSKPDEVWTALQ